MPGSAFTSAAFALPGASGALLLGRLDPGQLEEQWVDECWGVMWRVRSEVDQPEHLCQEFSCTWGPDTLWTETGWESGQSVVARSWEHGLTQVALGTIEPTALQFYAEQAHFHLPPRWFHDRPEFFEFGCIEASVAGVTVRYPALRAGEVCHAQFVVAWKARTDKDDQDAVLAVDLAPVQILGAALGTDADKAH